MGKFATEPDPAPPPIHQNLPLHSDGNLPELPAPAASPKGWRNTFRALRHRNFRLFVSGQTISLIGTWMQSVTQSWLVYRLTGSELMVGITGFCALGPVLVLGPLAGIAADRFSRYRIVLATQIVFTLQAATLALLTLTGRITVHEVFALAALWGTVNAFDIPARQALYIHMVGAEDLINAISLNSAVFNTARVVGPALAGILIAAVGEGFCFLLNAITFLAVITSLLMLRLPKMSQARPESPWAHLRDGFRYVYHHTSVFALLLVNSGMNFTRAPAVVLAPFFADAIFHHGAEGLGFLTGAAGLGAVLGTLGLARRTRAAGLPKVVFSSALTIGSCLVLFAWSPSFWLLLGIIAVMGYSQMRQNASTNTLIQTLIPDEFRGRIMALYAMTVVGMLPLGHLAGGAIAQRIGPRWTVFIGGLLCLAAALWFRRALPMIRRAVAKREAQ